ncbi:hypothetical protein A9P82_12025 [Arachidicoccus ginsenosidimutans]|nr:hypothetical protein A9P82_12025 [Arachidicoccus sp. BS20]
MRCLIVDDEPIGRSIVEDFVGQTTSLELCASCEDAFEAMNILQKESIDILFSDIQMPKINGIELVKSLPFPPAIIFITAHRAFAVDGYELNITDYLLKPVSYERFLKAVNKVAARIESMKNSIPQPSAENSLYIFLKANNKLNKILIDDIFYIEVIKDYVKINTGKNIFVTLSSMKAIEERLPADKFFKIHRAYVVALKHIKSIMGNMVELSNGDVLNIAKIRKEDLYKALNINDTL